MPSSSGFVNHAAQQCQDRKAGGQCRGIIGFAAAPLALGAVFIFYYFKYQIIEKGEWRGCCSAPSPGGWNKREITIP